jgi:hypothetical protein
MYFYLIKITQDDVKEDQFHTHSVLFVEVFVGVTVEQHTGGEGKKKNDLDRTSDLLRFLHLLPQVRFTELMCLTQSRYYFGFEIYCI